MRGPDFDKKFALAISFPTLRVFLSLVAEEDLDLHQMGVKTAFLYRDLEQDVFMGQHKSFRVENNHEFDCKLNKAIHGLKQAPR